MFKLWPAYVGAVVACAVLASLFQTQFNLAALSALGLTVGVGLRLKTTLLDLLGFAPFFALLCAPAFALALPVACWLSRRFAIRRALVCGLAGVVGLWVALAVVNLIVPMPTLIAADRSLAGRMCLLLAAALGALIFSYGYGKTSQRSGR